MPAGEPPDSLRPALLCWQMLGGIDWNGLPIVAEMIGVEDIELLIKQMLMLSNHNG